MTNDVSISFYAQEQISVVEKKKAKLFVGSEDSKYAKYISQIKIQFTGAKLRQNLSLVLYVL